VVIKKIFNNSDQKTRRRSLRSEPPSAEIILWGHLRKSQLGYKFRRQTSIGNYIVDFYCPKQKLVIEVDGDSHFEFDQIKYDKQRTQYMQSVGRSVIRFTNLEVYDDLENVLEKIKVSLRNNPLHPSLWKASEWHSQLPLKKGERPS